MFRRPSVWKSIPICILTPLLFVAAVSPARAQSVTGSIEGSVVDQTGAAMPGVTVTVVQPTTGVTRTTTSDSNGLFRLPLLPVGVYDLTADLSGFTSRQLPELGITVGQTVTLRIQMAVSGVVETVNVSGGTPIIETSRTQVSSTITETAVQNLPVNGRNFIDFALLTPGVTRDVRTGDISFAGQRGTLNSLVVDGADNNNTFFGQTVGRTGSGRAPYQFSQDAVKEFQVNSNSFSAEYGRAGGAVINVVTKSGTNDLHGSVFEFYRDKALNANNAINELNNRPKSPYHYNQFGGTLGGPIRPNRDFFFFNYDGQRNTQPNVVFLNLPANTPTDAATQAGIAALQPLAESWERRLDQDVFLIKTDHEVNDTNRLSFRYNQQNFTGEGFENGGAQNSIEHTGAALVKTNTFNASWTSIVGTTLFNELKFQLARDKEPGLANSANPEGVVQQSGTTVLTIGRNNFSPRETTIDRWQLANTTTWIRGQHKFKGGFDFQFDDILNNFPGFFSGSYTFRTLASFAGGRPNGANEFYQQNFQGPGTTGPVTHPNLREYSFFAQDEWRLRSDLTLNLGLRYDLMKTDAPPVRNPDAQLAAADIDTSRLDADTNNWGPRLGVAWSPADGRFAVRGGWGLFYGRTPSIMLGTAHSNNGINIVSLTFTGDAVPTYPAFVQPDASAWHGGATEHLLHRQGLCQLAADAGQHGCRMAVPPRHEPHRHLPLRGRRGSPPVDRSQPRHRLDAHVHAGWFEHDLPLPLLRNGPAVRQLHAGDWLRGERRIALPRPDARAHQAPREPSAVPRRLHARQGRGHRARRDRRRSGQRRRRHQVRLEPDELRRRSDRRQQRSATSSGGERCLRHERPRRAGGPSRHARQELVVQRHPQRTVGPAVHGARRCRRLERRREYAQRHRAGNQSERVPAAVDRHLRSAHRARDPDRHARLHLIWEAFNLFNRDNISSVDTTYYSVAGHTLTSSTTFGRPLASAGERIMQLAVKVTF